MLHLRTVPNEEFAQRKSATHLDNFIDPEFGEFMVLLNRLPFLYTFESCYGHGRYYTDLRVYSFLEGFVNFGLDANERAADFLERVKNVIQDYRQATHLAQSYPFHHGDTYFKPNEFHFGILPMNGLSVEQLSEGAKLASKEASEAFLGTRDQIWGRWRKIVSAFEVGR